jgi:putative PIN family toxin of toxin-antitoxin system
VIRTVFDTNIVVSALLEPLGQPARVFLLALAGAIQLCVSGDIYAEYEDVIRRPRLNRSENEIEGTLRAIREQALWIKPMAKIRACSDPDDNMFLECAESAHAHYVVTGNRRHFPDTWAGTRIVTARQFLEAMAETEQEPT